MLSSLRFCFSRPLWPPYSFRISYRRESIPIKNKTQTLWTLVLLACRSKAHGTGLRTEQSMLFSTELYYHRGKKECFEIQPRQAYHDPKPQICKLYLKTCKTQPWVSVSRKNIFGKQKSILLSITQHKRQFLHKVIMEEKISEFNSVNMALISRVKTHGLRDFLACPRVLLCELEKVTKMWALVSPAFSKSKTRKRTSSFNVGNGKVREI